MFAARTTGTTTETITEELVQTAAAVLPAREFFTGPGLVLGGSSNRVLYLSPSREMSVRQQNRPLNLQAAYANLQDLLLDLQNASLPPDLQRELESWMEGFESIPQGMWARAVAVLYIRVVEPLGADELKDAGHHILTLLFEGDVSQFLYRTELGLRIERLYLEALDLVTQDCQEQRRHIQVTLQSANGAVTRVLSLIREEILKLHENRVAIQRTQEAEIERMAEQTEQLRLELRELAMRVADAADQGNEQELQDALQGCRAVLRNRK